MFGEELQRIRMSRGISQSDLAEKFGYTYQFISNWERGESFPPSKCFDELMKYLEIGEEEADRLRKLYVKDKVDKYKEKIG